MSRQVHLSIVGLERLNPDIWDFMVYPDGWTDEQKSDLLDNIRMECYELEVIYSDSVFMMNAIGRWARKEKPVWNALKTTMEYSYNPIENTDRYEEETINDTTNKTIVGQDNLARMENQTGTSGTTEQTTGEDSRNTDETNTGSGSVTNGGQDITTNEVQGYDSQVYAPHDKSTVQYGGTQQSTTGGTRSVEETGEHSENTQTSGTNTNRTEESTNRINNVTESGDGTRGRTLHTHGNIGTMTVQSMILEQRDVVKFNLTDYIVDSFKQRFCILVY